MRTDMDAVIDRETWGSALQRVWRTRFGLREDPDMPRVDPPANNSRKFKVLEPTFNEDMARWKAEVEKEGGGTLEITHEEIIAAGSELLIFWRIVPKPAFARGRR